MNGRTRHFVFSRRDIASGPYSLALRSTLATAWWSSHHPPREKPHGAARPHTASPGEMAIPSAETNFGMESGSLSYRSMERNIKEFKGARNPTQAPATTSPAPPLHWTSAEKNINEFRGAQ